MSDTPTPPPAEDYAAKLARVTATVAGWLSHLIDADQVVELRALRVQDGTKGGSTWAGTFRGAEVFDLARAGLELSGNCQGVYYTLNPLRPERFVSRSPRVRKVGHGETAEDAHVLTRRWLLVDIDPVRDAKHRKDSTTDAEKQAAWPVLVAVREYLTAEGWPAPVVSDSGNGYHLLYRIGGATPDGAEGAKVSMLPTPEGDSVRRVLLHLADKFSSAAATIDTAVFNPARIVKLPGTLACKGENTAERPHRRARVIAIPGVFGE